MDCSVIEEIYLLSIIKRLYLGTSAPLMNRGLGEFYPKPHICTKKAAAFATAFFLNMIILRFFQL